MGKKKITRTELDDHLRDGLDALGKANKNKIKVGRWPATHSIDLDALLKDAEPNSPRWDYLLWVKEGRRSSEIYLEVHQVSDEHFDKIVRKAEWLVNKIETRGWPRTDGRVFVVAPTAGIPSALHGDLSRRLALKKIAVATKGDDLADVVEGRPVSR